MTEHTQQELPLTFPECSGDLPLLPARMVNEYDYCPGDMAEGRYVHRRVDQPSSDLPQSGMFRSNLLLSACDRN
ncbi:MAG: hypothetical protein HY273_10215 [Gammaproteobacteria bacterium]|nr:hypothetical protein [Gammaproteobacteria bacterium]